MKNIVAILAASVFMMLAQATDAEAKTYKGYWDGNPQWSSTLDFLGGKRLTYCFQGQCHTTTYSGSEQGTVRFNWGQARFTFTWNGSGYNVRRTGGGANNSGILR